MTNKELFETLSNCKFHQKYIESQNPKQETKEKPIIKIDWEKRKQEKNKLFLKYIKLLGASVLVGFFLFILPFLIVHPPFGKGFFLGIPPMLFVVLSWMGGAWWAYDKNLNIFMAVTLGAMPIRILFNLAWVYLAMHIPDVSISCLIFSMMFYWIVFTIPEIAMLLEFSKLQNIPESERQ